MDRQIYLQLICWYIYIYIEKLDEDKYRNKLIDKVMDSKYFDKETNWYNIYWQTHRKN